MAFAGEVGYLLDYTEWERSQWEDWFHAQGPETLAISLGPNTDDRIGTVGALVRHIFAAEQRCVDRIREVPISEPGEVSADEVDALFDFGRLTRQHLRQLLADVTASAWEMPREIRLANRTLSVMPKTIFVHAVTHEIRHWAQIAAFARMNGRSPGRHDFLLSGVFERAGSADAPTFR